jgi:hypothetical protein
MRIAIFQQRRNLGRVTGAVFCHMEIGISVVYANDKISFVAGYPNQIQITIVIEVVGNQKAAAHTVRAKICIPAAGIPELDLYVSKKAVRQQGNIVWSSLTGKVGGHAQ